MIDAFRIIWLGSLVFLIAAGIYAVFGVDAGPWLVITAVGASLWPRRRRRCCECDD